MNTVGPVINHPCTLCCRPTSVWCSRCQNAWYCMPEHLQTDWPRHRRECIPTTHMQNYNMIATPPPAEQQMITVPAILFESGASTTSPTGSNHSVFTQIHGHVHRESWAARLRSKQEILYFDGCYPNSP
ncbi:hypothetical protein EV401DRAFT_1172986 [Pisolithus croceorrhizus]|nr:hypothetical protein EV401DRAFT_1172986 [Pisolithus croceorrhizus]